MTAPDQIGAELVAARAAGIPWRVLMARYGLGRTRLWQLWDRAKAERANQPTPSPPIAGPPPTDPAGIAAELVAARAAGIPWKILEARHGCDRSKLTFL